MPEKPLPPFYCMKTLMGFGPGPDLNRITLETPKGPFVLCAMNEPRTEAQIQRWHDLAKTLSDIWESGR